MIAIESHNLIWLTNYQRVINHKYCCNIIFTSKIHYYTISQLNQFMRFNCNYSESLSNKVWRAKFHATHSSRTESVILVPSKRKIKVEGPISKQPVGEEVSKHFFLSHNFLRLPKRQLNQLPVGSQKTTQEEEEEREWEGGSGEGGMGKCEMGKLTAS